MIPWAIIASNAKWQAITGQLVYGFTMRSIRMLPYSACPASQPPLSAWNRTGNAEGFLQDKGPHVPARRVARRVDSAITWVPLPGCGPAWEIGQAGCGPNHQTAQTLAAIVVMTWCPMNPQLRLRRNRIPSSPNPSKANKPPRSRRQPADPIHRFA